MNLVDILVWVVLLIFAVKGFMKGLIREICSLLGLVVGSLTALVYYRPLVELLRGHIHLPHTVLAILSSGLILLTVGLLFFFLGHLLTTIFKVMLLGGINRLGGALLGILQGTVILCVVLSLATAGIMPAGVRSAVGASLTAQPFLLCGRAGLAWSNSGHDPDDGSVIEEKPVRSRRTKGSSGFGKTESVVDDS
jgi:membrane protein required for colicin V production